MKAKHTPGPWIATIPEVHVKTNHEIYYIHPDSGTGFIGPLELAIVYGGGNPCAKTDAELIALAPEMFDLLTRMSEFVKTGQALNWHALLKEDLNDETTVGEELLALIAKIQEDK